MNHKKMRFSTIRICMVLLLIVLASCNEGEGVSPLTSRRGDESLSVSSQSSSSLQLLPLSSSSVANNALSCSSQMELVNIFDSITDFRDGKVYRTQVIGTQTWMIDDLLFEVADGGQEGFYTWTAAMDISDVYLDSLYSITYPHRGICPDGFHVPSTPDWTKLSIAIKEINPENRNTDYSPIPPDGISESFSWQAHQVAAWYEGNLSENSGGIVRISRDDFLLSKLHSGSDWKTSKKVLRCVQD